MIPDIGAHPSMKSFRPLVTLALPLALAAGCASAPKAETVKTAPKAAPEKVSSQETSRQSQNEPQYAPQSQQQATVTAKQTAAVKKKGHITNYSMPKGFKRYRAPGAYNVNRLLYPKYDYFGVFTEGGGSPVDRANALGTKVGKHPNIIKSFYNWGDGFDANWAKSIWKGQSIPQFELEVRSDNVSVRGIANGQQDAYIRNLAKAIRKANVPVIFSPFHEFNGDWYQWGYCYKPDAQPAANACKFKTTPADIKRAWIRMHNIFKQYGATNAIWMWQANQVGARPTVKLKPFYPGDAYVDWTGIVGYYYHNNNWYHTFKTLFEPTIRQMHTFTHKPIMIPEMGMQPGGTRPADIKDFLVGVALHRDVIGFEWFNYNKPTEMDFRIESSAASLRTFKYWIGRGPFGFKVH